MSLQCLVIMKRMFRFHPLNIFLLNIYMSCRKIQLLTGESRLHVEEMWSIFKWGSKVLIQVNKGGLRSGKLQSCTLTCLLNKNRLLVVQKLTVGRNDLGDKKYVKKYKCSKSLKTSAKS